MASLLSHLIKLHVNFLDTLISDAVGNLEVSGRQGLINKLFNLVLQL